jgi:uncharacterized protein YjbI with pentapeptide repeats
MRLDDKPQQIYDRTQPLNYAGKKLRGRPFRQGQDLSGANFCGANLRGVNFKELNLAGSDFSDADIRGANFANATLTNANFRGAKAGLQKRWMIVQLILIFLVSTVLIFSSSIFNASYLAFMLSSRPIRDYTIVPGLAAAVITGVSCVVIAAKGLTAKAAQTIISIVSVIVAVTVAVAFSVSATGSISGAFAVAVASAVAVAVAVSFAVAVASVVSVIVSVSVAVLVSFRVAFSMSDAISHSVLIANSFAGTGAVTTPFAVAVVVLLLSLYVAWRTVKGDEKFALSRNLGIIIGAIGGTSFQGADLTAANFSGATLKSTYFNSSKKRQTILTHVCWSDAKQIDRAKTDGSILSDITVRTLLVGESGYKKTYIGANFYGANLDAKDLETANFQGANLSHALLRNAHLKGANLSGAQVIGADFTGAYLTGACIESWNIDAQTILKDVDCQHIFLLKNNCERRPSSGNFAPGEFTRLFEEVLNTIDLIFQDGIDWKAFVTAFGTLQVQNPDTELTIQSIENKGDGVVVVRVNAPPETNKAKIHSEFIQKYTELADKYQAELRAKNEQIIAFHREKYSDMKEITLLLAQQEVSIRNKVMINSQDQSRNFDNVNITAHNSVIDLGDISSIVTSTIHQLQYSSQPNAAELFEHLKRLQSVIEKEYELNDDEKAEALEEVNTLAQAAQKTQKEISKIKANAAIQILKKITVALTPTATMVKTCNDLLPVITELLGL